MKATSVALRSFPGFVVLVFLASSVAANVDYSENFENDTPPSAPDEDWYDFSFNGIGSGRTTTTVALNSISLLYEDTDAAGVSSARFDLSPFSVNFCQTTSQFNGVKFAVRIDSLGGTSSIFFNIQSTAAGGTVGARLRISNALAVRVEAGAVSGSDFATLALDTWYNITLSLRAGCAGGAAQAVGYISELDASGTATDPAFTCPGCGLGFFTISTAGVADLARLYMDNVIVQNVNDPPPSAVGSAATAAVTSLIGFDIDRTGTTAIARVSAGDAVETFSATSLGAALSSDVTVCGATNERVTAIATHVAYIDCLAGDPKELKIRAPSDLASDPDMSNSGCGQSAVCPTTITLEDSCLVGSGSNGLDDGTGDINDIIKHLKSTEHAPIDYTLFTDDRFANADSHAFAMGYSTNTGGDFGVLAFTGADNTCDTFSVARYSTATGGDIDGFCTWINTAGTTFIGAADPDIPPTIMSVSFRLDDGPDTSLYLTPVLGEAKTYSAYSGADSIACAESRLVFGFNNRFVVYDFGTDTVIMDAVHTGDGTNGVSITRDGEFALVRTSSTTVTLYAIDNQTAIATLTIPTGTYHSSALGSAGAQAWIATSAVIARYNISPFTNATCDQDDCSPPGPVATTVAPGLFAGQGAVVGASLGIGAFGGNLFMGVILIGMVAIGIGTATKNIPIALLGAVIGFLLGWAFGFFSSAVVFAVVIIVGILGFFFMRGRVGG